MEFCKFFAKFGNFVFCKIFLEIRKIQKYFVKISCFAKFDDNFAKHKTKNFMKISQNYETENFATTLLLHNLPSATHPPGPSARRFFNAAQQCYFEMKTNTEPVLFHSVIYNSVHILLFLFLGLARTFLEKYCTGCIIC